MDKSNQQQSLPAHESLPAIERTFSYRPGTDYQDIVPTQPLPTMLQKGQGRKLFSHWQPRPRWQTASARVDLSRHSAQKLPPAQPLREERHINIGRAVLIITLATLAARVLGLLRGSLFTATFGAGVTSDAFNRAFLLPNSIYTIVTGGALASAFIPVFNAYMIEKDDENGAWHIASTALSLALTAMLLMCVVAIIFARQLVALYNPGVASAQLDLVASLTRIMLWQAVVMGVGVIIGATLNARQHFLLPALGSVLYSAGLIIGLLPGFFMEQFHYHFNEHFAIYCATAGVVLGALLMVVVQLPGLRMIGMRYHFSLHWRHPGILQILRLMVPRVINAIAVNCSLAIDVVLISLLAFDGFVTQYNLAFTVMMIPLGMVINVATAMFPAMTEYAAAGRMDRLRAVVLQALRSTLFISIPAAIGLLILSLPVIQILYEHNRFTFNSALMTSFPLMSYAIGLPGWALGEILTRSFYALRDSKTPVLVSIWQFALKLSLSLLILNPVIWFAQLALHVSSHSPLLTVHLANAWGMGALALATSIAVLAEAAVLLWLLHQRIGGLRLRALALFVARIGVAALAMAVTILIVYWLLNHIFFLANIGDEQIMTLMVIVNVFAKLAITVTAGGFIYLRMARWLKLLDSEELAPIRRLLLRLRLSWI